MLGNNVLFTKPKDVLPTLHDKTYFKACETIRLNSSDPTQKPIFSSLQVKADDMPAAIRQIDNNLETLNPEKYNAT